MSTAQKKIPKPIVTPGPSPQGPPGWGEQQQERIASVSTNNEAQVSHDLPPEADQATNDASTDYSRGHGRKPSNLSSKSNKSSSEKGKFKSMFHKMGEKLAFVPPRNSEAGTSTQNASTMPEVGGT